MDKLCVSFVCVNKLCVNKLCVSRRAAADGREVGGSAQPKTRTPNKDAGKKTLGWNLSRSECGSTQFQHLLGGSSHFVSG